MQASSILKDIHIKIAIAFFILAIVLLISYQVFWALKPGMYEPDSYEYLLFAQLAIKAHSFNVSNIYLVYPWQHFFEHYGLFELPVMLHYILPFLPLIWDFRILYSLAIIVIYLICLLITRRILNATPLSKAYRYVCYSLVLLNYLLLQGSELVEYRGLLFAAAFQLIMFYLICILFLDWKVLSKAKRVLALLAIPCLILASWWMWSGYYVIFVPLALIPLFLLYKRIKGRKLYWALALFCIILAFCMALFNSQIDLFLIKTFNLSYYVGGSCLNNALSIGELQCLTYSNGLYTILLYLVFFALAIRVFLSDNIFARDRNKYDYLLIGAFCMALIMLPLAMMYLRLLQLIAPYMAICFSLGLVGAFARSGAGKMVTALVLLAVLISSVISFAIWFNVTSILYTLNNPPGLIAASAWLKANAAGSDVLGFYAWGDFMEYVGNVKVYADTIQELNTSRNQQIDNFYASSPPNCTFITSLKPQPDYILASNSLMSFVLFENASNGSIAHSPMLVTECGYSLAYSANGFDVFGR